MKYLEFDKINEPFVLQIILDLIAFDIHFLSHWITNLSFNNLRHIILYTCGF